MSGVTQGELVDVRELEWKGEWDGAVERYRELCESDDPRTRGHAHARLARCLLETCKPRETDEADDCIAVAERLADEISDPELGGEARLQRGRLYELQGELKRALGRYESARDKLAEAGVDLTEVDLVLASAERRRGELNAALARLEEIDEDSLPVRLRAEYLDERGAVHIARGETDTAVDILKRALDIDEVSATAYASGRSRLLLAEAHMGSGKRDRARKLIEDAIGSYEQAHADAGLSEAYALMGLWHEDREDYVAAAQYYQESYLHDRSSDDLGGQARAKRRLARTYRKRGDTDRAQELLGEARRLLPREDDVEAAAYFGEEGYLALTGSRPDYEEAIDYFRRALAIAEEDGDERVTAVAKRNLARAFREDDKLEEAEALLLDARVALEARGDLRELDDLLDDLGEVLLEQDRYEDALPYLQESLRLDDKLERIASKGRTLLLMGQVEVKMGKRDRAGEHYREALELYRSIKHDVGLSEAHRLIGSWHLDQGQTEKARDNLREALKIDNRLDVPLGRVRAHRMLAAVYRTLGDLERADEFLRDARRDLGRIDDPVEDALLGFEEGRVHLASGRYSEAQESLVGASHTLERNRSRADAASCKRHAALAIAYQGKYSDALNLLEQAREVFVSCNDIPELDELYDDLGTVYLLMGRADAAAESVRKSIDIGAGANWRKGKGRSLLLLGRIAKVEGEFDEARRHLDAARALYEEVGDEVGCAEAYLELGDWYVDPRNNDYFSHEEAVTAYKEARRLELGHRDPRGVARCNRKLAHVYLERSELQRAEEALQDAAASLGGVDDLRETAPLEYELGRLAVAKRDNNRAIAHFRRAIEGFSTLKQDDERNATYRLLIAAHQAEDQTHQALECIREMGAEREAMMRVLVKDLHPRVAQAAASGLEAREYSVAIVNVFAGLEKEFKERIDGSETPAAPASIGAVLDDWASGAREDLPAFKLDKSLSIFRDFCAASFALFRNPAVHDSPSDLSPDEAFAALYTAHWIAEVLDGRAVLGMQRNRA